MMHDQPAPAHDGLSDHWTPQDQLLRGQLETAAGRLFYESCDGVTQSLLMKCHWYLTTHAVALTLVLECPSEAMCERLSNHVPVMGDRLAQLSPRGRIRICPPPELSTPIEIQVDELSTSGTSIELEG
jgi:hypothetical protein